MNFLSLIFWVLKNLPSIITLVKAILDFIRGIKNPALHAQAILELKSAFREAVKTDSPEAIKAFADKYSISGVADSPTLKE